MYALTRDPINLSSVRDALVRPEDGAVATFEGIVRNNARGKEVRFLEYHAYESMALKKLEEVGALAKNSYSIRAIAIVHRLGRLQHCDCSVGIVVASAHRKAAFEACQFTIDTLKKIVPIWKKEFYDDGEVWIETGN